MSASLTSPQVSVLVFALNEEDGLPEVLAELEAFLAQAPFSSEVVFIDDGSTDRTSDVARAALPGARFVRHTENRGIGAALKSGAAVATGEWMTFMPADGQIPPETLATLFSATPDADVVFSIYGGSRDDGLERKLLSGAVRALIWAIHGVHMRSDGPYMIRRALFDPSQLLSDSFFLNFEVPIRAEAAKLRARVVPSECRPRARGHSKSKNLRTIARVARDLLALRLR